MSYSFNLIVEILEGYLSLSEGHKPQSREIDQVLSKISSGASTAEIIGIWKADIDSAISALAPARDIWRYICYHPTAEMLRLELGRDALSRRQWLVVGFHILQDETFVTNSLYKYEMDGIIRQIKRILKQAPAFCEVCGTVFKASRSDAKTCGLSKCRMAKMRSDR